MLPVHELVKNGNDFERVRQLLQRGENVNSSDLRGNTPLHILAYKRRIIPQGMENSVRMARVLIESGADVNKRNKSGFTPLLIAVNYENPRLVEFLLEKKADILAEDEHFNTVLHFAIKPSRGLVGHPDWDGYYAARKPVLEMVKTLLACNADIDARNDCDETPVSLAVEYRDFPVLKLLLQKGGSAIQQCGFRLSPMYYAVIRQSINLDIVIELLRHRAKFLKPVIEGFTPMDFFLKWLEVADVAKVEKAKSVFRGFLLGDESLTPNHQTKIEELSDVKGVNLAQFIDRHKNEKAAMELDELVKDCSVLFMARRGFYFITDKDDYSHVFDALQHKLKNSEYPLYHDIIVCSMSRKHLENKFTEACAMIRNTGRAFLDVHTSVFACSYLSHLDMFNCIAAFSSH